MDSSDTEFRLSVVKGQEQRLTFYLISQPFLEIIFIYASQKKRLAFPVLPCDYSHMALILIQFYNLTVNAFSNVLHLPFVIFLLDRDVH